MWEWILSVLQRQIRIVPYKVSGTEKDDIVANVCLYLCQHQDIAEDIYSNQKKGLLYQLLRHEIYEQKGRLVFKNKMEYCEYQKIKAVCDKYNIVISKENAYKISALLNNEKSCMTIQNVITILEDSEPVLNGFGSRYESLDAKGWKY